MKMETTRNRKKPLQFRREPCTREMVCRRTLELAVKAGRKPHEIKQVDYDRAKYEITGECDPEKQCLILDRGWR